VAIFALGNFYSAEQLFLQNFSHRGLRTSTVGYVGGNRSCPTYRNVMLGGSGHALGVRIEYDPNQISYAALVGEFNFIFSLGVAAGTRSLGFMMMTDFRLCC